MAAPPVAENIRAVIYPNQRSWNKETRGIESEQGQSQGDTEPPTATQAPAQQFTSERRDGFAPARMEDAPAAGQFNTTNVSERRENLANGNEKGQSNMAESGLAQLSRMLDEQRAAHANSAASLAPPAPPTQTTQNTQTPQAAPALSTDETFAAWQAARAADPAAPNNSPMSSVPLRVSPIQDIPVGREDFTYTHGNGNATRNGSAENRTYTESRRPESGDSDSFPQSSSATPLSVLASIAETPIPSSPAPTLPTIVEQELSPAEVKRETSGHSGTSQTGENHRSVSPTAIPPQAAARDERLDMQPLPASLQTILTGTNTATRTGGNSSTSKRANTPVNGSQQRNIDTNDG